MTPMSDLVQPTSEFPIPPWRVLRARLSDRASELAGAGDVAGAAVLRTLIESWWREQEKWDAAARELLRANHEINNALVGVSGNAQLMLLSPAGQVPKVRERLQMVLRESERIERAAQRLQALKCALANGEPDGLDTPHAA
jgi:signal transduction histidine kinase